MVMFRGGYAAYLAPGIKKVAFDEYTSRPIESKAWIKTATSKRAYETTIQFTGFGSLRRKPEGAPVPFEDPLPGPPKIWRWETFALGFSITLEMRQDELYAITGERLTRAMSRSARNNYDILAYSVFNNAFNTAFSGFAAGESLVGTHTGIRGGIISNTPATPSDLTLPALQAGVEHFMTLNDEGGLPIQMRPKWLIHTPQDYWIARQLLKSAYLPGGNQNDINQMSNENITPFTATYLSDPDAWFLLGADHSITMYERWPYTVQTHENFHTKDAEVTGLCRRGVDWDDWRGVYGSSGE